LALYHALIFAGLTAWNTGVVWFFCVYAPARWDSPKPGETPFAPALIPYTLEEPDMRGLV